LLPRIKANLEFSISLFTAIESDLLPASVDPLDCFLFDTFGKFWKLAQIRVNNLGRSGLQPTYEGTIGTTPPTLQQMNLHSDSLDKCQRSIDICGNESAGFLARNHLSFPLLKAA
jgi:hypothetical protein